MRWLFLLLVILNVVYYVWHQQQAPLRIKEIAPLSLYKGSQQDIQLLREQGRQAPLRRREECLVVGGILPEGGLQALRQRLLSLDIESQPLAGQLPGADGQWLKIASAGERLLDASVLETLSKDFKDLKHKIISCEGIALAE